MKVSTNTLRALCDQEGLAKEIIPKDINALLDKIGSQLGAVEEVIYIRNKYKGATIVKVVSCDDHPDADRLHLCRVDDGKAVKDVERGEDGLVQVVCGAPNVKAGMLAVWLPPGATVPASLGEEPFVLEARDLRGQKSNGMLASMKELDLGDDHAGLAVVDEGMQPGTPFAKAYNLQDDVIIELENKMFTHRPDCFGWLGVARELAGIQHKAFSSPSWYTPKATVPAPKQAQLPLTIKNELPELVPRLMAVSIANVQLGPSPLWLQVELAKLGHRPINNIVDYTNYFMLLTGQPLHAYDYDKVKTAAQGPAVIGVRHPQKGEKLLLLGGKEIEPRDEAILITNGKVPIGLGGVMGGAETEVTAETKNIILECANFNMYSIRRTSMQHGLFTDAVTRFNKGQSPLQNPAVLARITDEILKQAGGTIASEVCDDNHLSEEVMAQQSLHAPVAIPAEFVTSRLGRDMTAESMATLLKRVEFGAEAQDSHLMVKAPFWRTDIEIPEDVVEEVGRLYGFDRLPLNLPVRSILPAQTNQLFALKAVVRDQLSRLGANEVLTYSFVHGNLLDKVSQDKKLAFALGNALSPDLQYYRLSLLPSLLDKVYANNKAGYDQFALFELGKAHVVVENDPDEPTVPKEINACALVFAANAKAASQYSGAPYYQAMYYLRQLIGEAPPVTLEPLAGADLYNNEWLIQTCAPFEPMRSAVLRDERGLVWGVVGEFKASVRRALKLPDFTAGFEIDPLLLTEVTPKPYEQISKYPKVTQDITLKVSAELPYAEICKTISADVHALKAPQTSAHLAPLTIFQRPEDPAHKQVSFRLTIASYEKTLTDGEVNKLLDDVAERAHKSLGSERV